MSRLVNPFHPGDVITLYQAIRKFQVRVFDTWIDPQSASAIILWRDEDITNSTTDRRLTKRWNGCSVQLAYPFKHRWHAEEFQGKYVTPGVPHCGHLVDVQGRDWYTLDYPIEEGSGMDRQRLTEQIVGQARMELRMLVPVG